MVDLVIVGGGLAGSLVSLALARRRPEIDFLLIEGGPSFGGNHTWSFFDSDIAVDDRWLVELLLSARWEDHQVRFPRRVRHLSLAYNSIRSEQLNRAVREHLKKRQYRLNTSVKALGPHQVQLQDGSHIEARAIIDARGPGEFPGLDLAWQKFVGVTLRFGHGHGETRPTIMDATVDQTGGYHFVYTLPFSEFEMLVEDTWYSRSPVIDRSRLIASIHVYADARGWEKAKEAGVEIGVLPIALDGDFDVFWPATDKIARLGLRGGFFHPTTGYSLPDAVANAILLSKQKQFSSSKLHDLLRAKALRLWRERGFYRLLNRMLFEAAAPS